MKKDLILLFFLWNFWIMLKFSQVEKKTLNPIHNIFKKITFFKALVLKNLHKTCLIINLIIFHGLTYTWLFGKGRWCFIWIHHIWVWVSKQEICKKVRNQHWAQLHKAQQWTDYCRTCLVTCYYPGDCSSYLVQPPFTDHIILFQHQTECKRKLKTNLYV